MSFQKAADLLRLAEMATSRYSGVGLGDIEEEFGIDRRTAQRMTKMLEETFPHCTTRVDDNRRKFWRLDATNARLMLAQGIRATELVAINLAIQRAARDGVTLDAQALRSLRDRLLSAMPSPHARRMEADAEALLEAYGFASRPGPQTRTRPALLQVIAEALKAPNLLRVSYKSASGAVSTDRLLEPHGLILGTRRYLVARAHRGDNRMRHFRLDRIETAVLEASSFERARDFDLASHSARAFGSYHDDAEYSEVVWRFCGSVRSIVRDFIFHPQQDITENPDGTVTVRFWASGHLEMAWHLYQWGDKVEVLAPEGLRALVAGHQRSDFDATP